MISASSLQFSRIALIGKYRSPEAAESVRILATYLRQRGLETVVEEETAALIGDELASVASFESIGAEADIAIVVGGDGTLLNSARHLASFGVPLVGVNQGRLGFMTDVSREAMIESMDDLLSGNFSREERFLIEARVVRDGVLLPSNLALNDIVLSKANPGRMIEFELHIDGELIYVLRADGMIISTPTGSTAYALSANGPILHPSVSGIAVVPLCPHGMSYRPITVSASSTLELVMIEAYDGLLHSDGQDRFEVCGTDRIVIRHSGKSVVFLHPPGYSYFAMLREKLHWSATPKRV